MCVCVCVCVRVCVRALVLRGLGEEKRLDCACRDWGLYAGGKGSLLPRGCFRQKEGGCREESALSFPMCG